MSSPSIYTLEGAVAFLDALGTKGIWARSEPKKYVESWELLLTDWKKYSQQLYPNDSNIDTAIKAFSDTVIITTSLKKKDDKTPVVETDRVVLHAARLIQPMVLSAITRGIYLRGVISIGKFYESDAAIIGPAVDEAAEWYTETEWIGVSAAPTAHFVLEKLVEVGGELKEEVERFFVRYNIPTKTNTLEAGWVLNWPKIYKKIITPPGGMSVKAIILNRFAQNPISVSAIAKFNNTIKFIDHVMSADGHDAK